MQNFLLSSQYELINHTERFSLNYDQNCILSLEAIKLTD